MTFPFAILHRDRPDGPWVVVAALPSLDEAAAWLDALAEFAPDRWAVRARAVAA